MDQFKKMAGAFVFIFILNSQVSRAQTNDLETLNAQLSIGMTLEQILDSNPHMRPKENKNIEPRKNGSLSMRGPLNFTFVYGNNELLFNDVKTVLYPIKNYRVKFIHLYPQLSRLTHQQMLKNLQKIDSKLDPNQWEKSYQLPPATIQKELVNRAYRDIASYKLKKSSSNTKNVEMVVTAYKDATVKCASANDCENQYLRVAFY